MFAAVVPISVNTPFVPAARSMRNPVSLLELSDQASETTAAVELPERLDGAAGVVGDTTVTVACADALPLDPTHVIVYVVVVVGLTD